MLPTAISWSPRHDAYKTSDVLFFASSSIEEHHLMLSRANGKKGKHFSSYFPKPLFKNTWLLQQTATTHGVWYHFLSDWTLIVEYEIR